MKILITGGKGMLGRTLLRHWNLTHQCYVADLPETDLTDLVRLHAVFDEFHPDVVVHCVAMTRVDDCEAKRDRAFQLNATVTENVAKACSELKARLIAISTDYVFSGDERGDRSENDATSPKTVYGASKLAGEEAIRSYCPNSLIVRIAWLYGAGGPSFVHTMIQLAQADPTRTLKIVNDQMGNPTSTDAVANALSEFLKRPELCGTFHLTCEGTTSWYEFAKEIFKLCNFPDVKLCPCSTEEFPRPAPRPHFSSLSKKKLADNALAPMPSWQQALSDFIATEYALPANAKDIRCSSDRP